VPELAHLRIFILRYTNVLIIIIIIITLSVTIGHIYVCSTVMQHNNSSANIYDAVIMTKAIARLHPVHLMNADLAPGGRQLSDQAKQLGL